RQRHRDDELNGRALAAFTVHRDAALQGVQALANDIQSHTASRYRRDFRAGRNTGQERQCDHVIVGSPFVQGRMTMLGSGFTQRVEVKAAPVVLHSDAYIAAALLHAELDRSDPWFPGGFALIWRFDPVTDRVTE